MISLSADLRIRVEQIMETAISRLALCPLPHAAVAMPTAASSGMSLFIAASWAEGMPKVRRSRDVCSVRFGSH
jgi:hypothetical protein